MDDQTKNNSNKIAEPTGLAGFFLRIFWVFVGNVIFLFLAYSIASNEKIVVGALSALYWLDVATLICARYLDIHFYKGLTTESEPATMAHFKRYSLRLLVLTAALFVLVILIRLFL